MLWKKRGLSTLFFLALGIIIGVVIVVFSASIIKSRLSSHVNKPSSASPTPAPSSVESPAASAAAPEASKEATATRDNSSSGESVRLDLVKDPVCGKLVNPNTDFQYKFKTRKFCFCSEQCMRTFEDDPLPYIDFTMKVQVTIQPLTGESSAPSGTARPTPEVALPRESGSPGGSTLRELPPINGHGGGDARETPAKKSGGPSTPVKVMPTPEEIPLSDDGPPVKTTKTMAPPASKSQPAKGKPTKELQIEEIPLE
jgi:YHS domain-containing protein